ncbi:lipoate--protein ligase [Acidaminobacterium chupaoyuni]
MIEKTQLVVARSTNPYENLALEEYLLDQVRPGVITLYLWQNRQTVVIGQNQNAWQECRVKQLEEEGGHLARRLSGGGAVFHDLGNLNFTFLVPREEYDVTRQCRVIARAVASYGLEVERTGRNDILIEGRKFSGNAFFRRGDTAYHHGTLLLSVDMANLSRYLNVSQEKLRSKGVASVAARVANLTEFCPAITAEEMRLRLADALGEEYGAAPEKLAFETFEENTLRNLTDKYSSWDWKFGKKLPFDHTFTARFPWGGVQICLSVNSGIITHAEVYSDAMDSDFFKKLPEKWRGLPYQSALLRQSLKGLALCPELGYEADETVLRDLDELLSQQNF